MISTSLAFKLRWDGSFDASIGRNRQEKEL